MNKKILIGAGVAGAALLVYAITRKKANAAPVSDGGIIDTTAEVVQTTMAPVAQPVSIPAPAAIPSSIPQWNIAPIEDQLPSLPVIQQWTPAPVVVQQPQPTLPVIPQWNPEPVPVQTAPATMLPVIPQWNPPPQPVIAPVVTSPYENKLLRVARAKVYLVKGGVLRYVSSLPLPDGRGWSSVMEVPNTMGLMIGPNLSGGLGHAQLSQMLQY